MNGLEYNTGYSKY